MSALSTMSHRLYRDIFFSTSIGRDSPFDPFQERDITTLSGKRRELHSSLMYFAVKPLPRCPAPVNYAKMPDPKRSAVTTRTVTQAVYHPQFPNEVAPSVSFTRASRLPPRPASVAGRITAEQTQGAAGGTVRRRDGADDLGSPSNGGQPDLRSHSLCSVVQVPDASHAPSIGKMSGRGWTSEASARRTRKCVASVFPWDKTPAVVVGSDSSDGKTAKAGDGEAGSGSGTAHRNRSGDRSPPLSHHPSLFEEGGHVAPGDDGRPVSAAGHANAPVPSGANTTSAAQGAAVGAVLSDEDWLQERKQLIARFGLVTGGGRKDRVRRAIRPKGPDFAAHTGREAPARYMPHGQQFNDLTYDVRYDATTRERKKLADVRLARYAARPTSSLPAHMETANKVIEIERLVKFHEQQVKAQQKSALALPATYAGDTGGSTGSIMTGFFSSSPLSTSDGSRPSGVPRMSAADEFNCNPESHHPPKVVVTRVFRGAPDLGMYSSRPDEPIRSTLAADPTHPRVGSAGRSMPRKDAKRATEPANPTKK